MTKRIHRVAPLVFTLLAACGLGPYGRVTEMTSSNVPGDSIRAIVVIAGEPDDGERQIAGQIIQRLSDAGVTATSRRGLWEDERAALAEICPQGQAGDVQGVLFVWWNQLDLRYCPSHTRAFQIHGAYRGVGYMVQRLLRYLRVEPRS